MAREDRVMIECELVRMRAAMAQSSEHYLCFLFMPYVCAAVKSGSGWVILLQMWKRLCFALPSFEIHDSV